MCLAVLLPGCLATCFGQSEQPEKHRKYPAPVFGVSLALPNALRGSIYYLPVDTTRLPDFKKLRPAGTVWATTLNVPTQAFTAGFPGVTNRIEWFAIDYEGDFFIDRPGNYAFDLTSDDGSILRIDGKEIINNDGLHQAVTVRGAAKLTHGIHHMELSYFQGPRWEVALKLEVAGPKEKWHVFSMAEFRLPDEPETPEPPEKPAQ
ncbi:MAG: PA14 domain-containing protein [Bryobacteraceae bacterium]|nr:PA14 domain-containing protein [Bryobacteraceae bacterium]